MSNGIVDVHQSGVLATVDGKAVHEVGKVGEWMPWGDGSKGVDMATMWRVEQDITTGEEKHVDPEVMEGSVEIQWGIEWSEPREDYPNAIAHVYSYPGDYLLIGRYENGIWTRYGGAYDDEVYLPRWDKVKHVIQWDEAYKHLPALHILYPSDSETPGGKSTEIGKFLFEASALNAQVEASLEAFSMIERENSATPCIRLVEVTSTTQGIERGEQGKLKQGPGVTYTFAFHQGEGHEPVYIDVLFRLNVSNVVVRPNKDTLPEWMSEDADSSAKKRDSEAFNALLGDLEIDL